jgi:IstB-like ATP binding protein
MCFSVGRRATAVPDRRRRHRQVPPADRAEHRRGRTRPPGPPHHRRRTDKQTGRGRRRPARELLFRVLTEREEKASIAIASNAAFSEWVRTFTDPRLCAAIVDRLTFDAHIIETGSESYRLKTTRQKRETTAARTASRQISSGVNHDQSASTGRVICVGSSWVGSTPFESRACYSCFSGI